MAGRVDGWNRPWVTRGVVLRLKPLHIKRPRALFDVGELNHSYCRRLAG